MASLSDIQFWLMALLLVAALPLSPLRRTTSFGLLNLVALGIWLGWQLAAVALGFSVFLWAVVGTVRSRQRDQALAPTLSTLALLVIVALFSLHKLNLEYAELVGPLWQSGALRAAGGVLTLLAALSFSYVALRATDLCLGVLFGGAPLLGPLSCAGYLFPFHMIISGPISSYRDHVRLNDRPAGGLRTEQVLLAANDIATGAVYKYVISDHLRLLAFGATGPLRAEGFVETALLLVYLFFDFGGYSRIVYGLGRLLDIPTPVNFDAPFRATSITEFFTRWHISLGAFIARNVYTPLQLSLVRTLGLKRALWAGLAALMVSWALVGAWHRYSVRFLLWYGMGMALLIYVEKLIRDRLWRTSWSRHPAVHRAAAILGPAYVFVVITAMTYLVRKEIYPS